MKAKLSFIPSVKAARNHFARARSIVAVCIILLVSGRATGEIRYSVLDLGTLGTPGSNSTALGVNNLGQVVGLSNIGGGIQLAFRTEPNQPINPATDDLGTLGGTNSAAYGINNSGQVVGYSYISGNGTYHAFQTAANQPINPVTDDLGTLGGTSSIAYGINNSGQVVGWSYASGNLTGYPFRTAPNQPINPATDNLLPTGGINGNVAYAINSSGQVAGYATPPNVSVLVYAFRTGPNQPINYATDNLGTLGETTGYGSDAYGINDSGQVVGAAWLTSNVTTHAFRTEANQPINPATDDLGTLPGNSGSEALGINSSGVVVGISYTGDSDTAFIYTGSGPMQDLNSLIDPSLGVSLFQANAINDLGQIVGFGQFDDGNHAFLLTPIPEPSSALLALVGMAALCLVCRRRRAVSAFAQQ